MPVRIAMLGTGDFAAPTFARLIDDGFDVAALITQPDRPQGRRQELIPARIKLDALRRGVRVEQPEDINAQSGVELVRSLGVDLLVTAAYGQILSPSVLEIPRLGGLNVHGSILPAYRGAAPVARAIERGETETGVTIIQMSPRVDAGGMISVARAVIGPDETAGELEARLAELGAGIISQAIRDLASGAAQPIAQDRSKVSKAPKLKKTDGQIDWSLPAPRIHNLVRAMQPWPTAYTDWRPAGAAMPVTRLIIHRTSVAAGSGAPGSVLEASADRLVVAAGDSAIRVIELQTPGKKRMPASEFLRGHRISSGDQFGAEETREVDQPPREESPGARS